MCAHPLHSPFKNLTFTYRLSQFKLPKNSFMAELEEALIKKELTLALEQDPVDYDKVLQLSNQLAGLDKANVRFSVDAGVINRLGKELVGRSETALSELVKNAFDADASNVDLTFINSERVGGTLKIKDNGSGMTREQLINGFMRISSTDKVHHPKSPRFQRVRAGRKGIGRFATQRLGHKLTIITQPESAEEALEVVIEWDRFLADTELFSVSNQIKAITKKSSPGTLLIIDGLREAWSDAAIKRVYRYVSELLQPFPLSKQLPKSKTDPGFKVTFYRQDVDGNKNIVIDEQKAFLDQALAEINGKVDGQGNGHWSLKSERLNLDLKDVVVSKDKETSGPYTHLKNTYLRAYYYIFDPGLIPPQQFTFIRDTLKVRGGIRVYRNGFRVLPYGERDDDWAGLEESVRGRVILPPHGNNNFVGFIEITDPEGEIFEETASREGLFENDAFDELSRFTFQVLISAVLKIAEARSRKGTAGQKRLVTYETPTQTIEKAANKAIEVVEELKQEDKPVTNRENNPAPTQQHPAPTNLAALEESLKVIIGANQEQRVENNRLIDEINQLRVLAGIGLVIGQFIHEIKTYVTAFRLDIHELLKLLRGNEEALSILQNLDTNVQAFTTYRSYFERIFSDNISRELQPIELREVVNPFVKTIEPDAKRSGILVHSPIFEGYDLSTIPMHRSEWASILFNFYSNSKKAIFRAKRKGEVQIRCGKTDQYVFLEFSDNGDGIHTDSEDKIFDAFFTTSQPASRNAEYQEELTGMGLGLKIVRDIVESYRGEVYVSTPQMNFSTTIRIEIPRNPKKSDGNKVLVSG